MKEIIEFDDFSKVDIRIGRVTSAENMEGSDKLIKLSVDFGSEIGTRTILTGLREWFSPNDFLNKQLPFIVNLKPRKMMGIYSEGMILAVGDENPTLVFPEKPVENGQALN